MQITPDHTIKQILEIAPTAAIIFQNANLDCTGCNANTARTLKQVIKDNQINPEKSQKLLQHLNNLDQINSTKVSPQPADFQLQEIQEANKKYYKLAGLLFTENAYKNLHQLATAKGLSITLQTGGCSGFKYQYDFQDQPQKEQKTYTLSPQLNIYLDDFTFSRSQQAVVDFTISLHSSGLQIINPNQKRSCSCGTSIGF